MKKITLIGLVTVLTLAGGLRPELFVKRLAAAPPQTGEQPAGEKPADDINSLRLYVMFACVARNTQQELKLNDDQFAAMEDVMHRLEEARAFAGESEKTRQALSEATTTIHATLSPQQERRLKQLRLQVLRTNGLSLLEVIAALKLSGEQQQKLHEIALKTAKSQRALDKNIDMSLSELNAKRRPILEEAQSASLAVLTPAQRREFEDLEGPAFDFTKPGRSRPNQATGHKTAPVPAKAPSPKGTDGQVRRAAPPPAKLPKGNDIEDTQGTWQLLIERWRENQCRLRSGIVRFHGRSSHTWSKLARRDRPDEGLWAFDFDRGLFRFDRSSVPGPISEKPVLAKWIISPDKTIRWIKGQQFVEIYEKGTAVLLDLNWFDVRSLCFLDERSPRRDIPPDELFDRYSSQEAPTLISEEHGVYRTVWVSGGGWYREILWLDANQGFTPVRKEAGRRSDDGSKWLPPEVEARASWQKIGDTWVVKTVFSRDNRRNDTEELGLAFDWESVNTAVGASYFEIGGIGAEPGIEVAELRPDQRVVVESIIGKNGAVIPKPQMHISAVASSKPIKATLSAEQVQLVAAMAESASPARTGASKLRVAIFTMEDHIEPLLLAWKLQCKAQTVTAQGIRGGSLKTFDVVLFPGGKAKAQAKELGDEGRHAVRQFVKDGGGYVGICAGAFLASCQDSSHLNLINVAPVTGKRSTPELDIDMAERGAGILKLELTDAGSKILGQHSGFVDTWYAGGPVFHPAGRSDLPGCVSLAFYRTEIWLYEPQRGTMVDTPAVLAAPFGKGRVIIFSNHPEALAHGATPGLETFVTRAILATARKSQ